MFNSSQSNLSVLKNTMLIYVRNLPFNAQCNCRPMYRSRACLCVSYDSHDEQRWYELVLLSKGYAVLYLLLLRASCRFTKYHTTNKCTNCMSFRLAFLHEKQRTQIQDMLPQQYYNENVHIFNT